MKHPIVAANWKMNHVAQDAQVFFSTLFSDPIYQKGTVSVVVCPPAPLLHTAAPYLDKPRFYLGAQTVHELPKGAFTGEISVSLLVDAGCKTVLVGHSERRHLYGESNGLVAKKAIAAAHAGLTPIFCVGETLVDREGGKTFQVIRNQLNALFQDVPFLAPFVIAYEPVWAIGTGQVATPEQAQEVHAFIHQLLCEHIGEKGKSVPILYGGSVTPENATSLLCQPDINGALVGGASLKANSFLQIMQAAESTL